MGCGAYLDKTSYWPFFSIQIDTRGNTLRVIGIQVVAEGPVLVIKLFNLADSVRKSSAQDAHRLSISTATGSDGRSSGEVLKQCVFYDEESLLSLLIKFF